MNKPDNLIGNVKCNAHHGIPDTGCPLNDILNNENLVTRCTFQMFTKSSKVKRLEPKLGVGEGKVIQVQQVCNACCKNADIDDHGMIQ